MSAQTNQNNVSAALPDRLLVPLLAIAGMVSMLNIGILGPLMPDVSRDLGVSYPVLGQITAAVFFGSAIVGLFVGPLGDQYGRKRLVVFALAIVAISTVGSALAPTFGWLFAIRMISAISGGIMAGTAMAIAGTLFDGPARQRAIGSIAAGMAAAPIFGIPILTTIAEVSSWRMSLAFMGGIAIALAILAQWIIPDDASQVTGRIDIRTFLSAYRPLIGSRSMTTLFGASITRAIGWMGLITYLGAFWADQHGLSVADIGFTSMFIGIWYFIGTKLGGRLTSISLRPLFGTSTMLCAVAFGMAIAAPVSVWIAILLLCAAAATGGIGFVALTAIISTETPAGQGTTMSLNGALFTLGSAFGGALGGGLLAAGGCGALGSGLMGFMILSAVMVWHPAWLRVPAVGRSVPGH